VPTGRSAGSLTRAGLAVATSRSTVPGASVVSSCPRSSSSTTARRSTCFGSSRRSRIGRALSRPGGSGSALDLVALPGIAF